MREAREAALGALRQSSKTTSEVLTNAAERFWAKRGKTQPVEGRQFTLALVPAGPRIWANLTLAVKFVPGASLFSGKTEKREMGGCKAQPSSWLKSPPPARAGTPLPRAGGALTPPHRGQRCPHNHSLSQTPAARSAAPGGFLPSGGIRRWAWTGTSGR